METHPPRLIEVIIERLIPGACRENVLGDWNERYNSTPAYILRALYTLPFLVTSQIRRTFRLERLVSEAVLLYIAYAAALIARSISLYRQPVLVPVLIVIGTALLALTVRDAYADPEGDPIRQTGWDIAVAIAAVFGVEVILSAFHLSRLMLPWWFVFAGYAAIIPMLFMVRQLFRAAGRNPAPLAAGSMSLDELRQRSTNEHRQAWRLNLAWLIAGLAVIITSPNIQRPSVGPLSGLLLIAILIHGFWRHRAGLSKVSQEYTALSISRNPHRNELERKRDGLNIWAGGGLFSSHGTGATVVFFLIGLSLVPFLLRWIGRMPFPLNVSWMNVWLTISASAGLAVFWVFVRLRSLRAARAIQDELDALDKKGEQQ